MGSAYYTTQTIDPEEIEVWDGAESVPVEDADAESIGDDAIAAAEFEANEADEADEPDDDGDGYDENDAGGYFLVDFDLFSPPEP